MNWKLFAAADFDRWQEALTALNAAGPASPALSPAFVHPLLAFFGTGDELVAVCEGTHGPLALALLSRQGFGTWVSFPPNAQVGVLLDAHAQDLESLLAGLFEALPGYATAISIMRQDPQLRPRPPDAGRIMTVDGDPTASIRLAASFANYWAGVGRTLQLRIASINERLGEEHIEASLEVITGAQQVEHAVAEYARLESSGAGSPRDAAIHPNSSKGWFYRTMLEGFCRDGRGRIHCLRFNGRVVAMDFCIRSGDALLVLKSACDESLAHLSPALLLREQVLRDLHEEGRTRVLEIHGATAAAHGEWLAEFRVLYRIDAYRWPWLARMRRSRPPADAEAAGRAHYGSIAGAGRPAPPAIDVARRIDDRAAAGALKRGIANLRGKALAFGRTSRELGGLNGAVYALDRLIDGASGGTARLHKYDLMAQPVAGKRWLPPRRGADIAVRRIAESDPVIHQFPRAAHAIPFRFRQDAVCLCAWKDTKWIGFLWLTLGPYQEDEVRCRYVPLPAGASAWDFDVYLIPEQRNGIAFLKLWDEANIFLSGQGYQWSLSRISAFNPGSINSHSRMGARRIGAATFLSIGPLQLCAATVRPYLHVSVRADSFPSFALDPGKQRGGGAAP